MIVTAAALVVVAFAMLAWGFLAEQLTAVYASVAISSVSAILLAVGMFLRRRELFGEAARTGKATAPGGAAAVGTAGLGKTAVPVGGAQQGARRDTAGGTGVTTAPAPRRAGGPAASPAQSDDAETYPVPTGLDVPGDAIVHVVPGRRRYHLGSCRQLKGRESEELTYEEAHEEGFSACTACMPDTALAARASRTPRPRRTTPEPSPAVTPAGSTWDGQSADPEEPEKSGSGSGDDTVGPANSTWDGQSVKPEESEKSDSDEDDTVSPANSTWDGQSVKPEESEEPGSGSGDDTVGPANSTWDGQSVKPEEGEAGDDDAEDGTEKGEASTDADAGGAGEDAGDGESGDTDAEPVQVVQGTKRYHRPECALVNAVPEDEITSMALARAMEEGYGPCLACEPDKAPAR